MAIPSVRSSGFSRRLRARFLHRCRSNRISGGSPPRISTAPPCLRGEDDRSISAFTRKVHVTGHREAGTPGDARRRAVAARPFPPDPEIKLPHFQSEVQHRPASGARAWPERRRRAGVEGFSGQGPGFHAEYGGCPFGSERNRASRRRQGPAAGGGAPVRAREGVARPKPGGRACGIPSPPSADGAKRLREAAPARKPPPASGSRAPCGGARSGCPGPASRGRP